MTLFQISLALLFTVSLTNKLGDEEVIAETGYRTESAVSPEAVQFRKNIQRQVKEYDCSRDGGSKDCAAWGAAELLDDLELGRVNCDEEQVCDEAEKCDHARLCDRARKALGDESTDMPYEDMKKGLLAQAQEVFTKEHEELLNPLWISVSDYVCYKEPASCAALREEMAELMQFEAVVDNGGEKKKQ